MTAGYRDFRPRDEDPNDHAAVAAMQARLEAVKADEAFRQAMLAAIAAGQECARTAVSPVAGAKRLILPEGVTARRYDVRSHALRLFDQLLRPIVRLAM